jgi:hypothetical protein
VQLDDEGVLDFGQDVPLHLGADAVADLERGLAQHLHRVQGAGVLGSMLWNGIVNVFYGHLEFFNDIRLILWTFGIF